MRDRSLATYYTCDDDRPEIQASFLGYEASTSSDSSRATITLTAAQYRTGNLFWSNDGDLNSWLLYDGTNSLLDCNSDGTDTACRDTTLATYFRFTGNEDGSNTFPRVEMIKSATNSTLEIIVSATTDTAGPMVIAFLYNATDSSDDCNWTPYQVAAWVIAVAPEISGMIQGGLSTSTESSWKTDGLIVDLGSDQTGTKISGSPGGNWIRSDSTYITIGGSNFAAEAENNIVTIVSNAAAFDAAVLTARSKCSTSLASWSPTLSTVSATCTDSDDAGQWMILKFTAMGGLNGGIPMSALLTNGTSFIYDILDDASGAAIVSSANASMSFPDDFYSLNDINWNTTLDLPAGADDEWILGVLVADSFEARSLRISVSSDVSVDRIPSGHWTFEGGSGTCSLSGGEITCSTWTVLLNQSASFWYQNDGCDSWVDATTVDESLRGYYAAYRVVVDSASFATTSCCSVSEIEIDGVDFSAWLTMSTSITTTSNTFTSSTYNYVASVQTITPILDDTINSVKFAIPALSSVSSSYTLSGKNLDNLDTGSSNRIEIHFLQPLTPGTCCAMKDVTSLSTMQSRLKAYDRYIPGTESATNATDLHCGDTDNTITCYLGVTMDSWTLSQDDVTVCPCNATVSSATSSPTLNGSVTYSINPRWGTEQSFQIGESTPVYGFVEVQGSRFYSNIVTIGSVDGVAIVNAAAENFTTNTDYITISGQYFSTTEDDNTVVFTTDCSSDGSSCNLDGFRCSVDMKGTVVTSDSTTLIVRIDQLSYLSACTTTPGATVSVVVSVEGISGASASTILGSITSVDPQLNINSSLVLQSNSPLITITGYGFAPYNGGVNTLSITNSSGDAFTLTSTNVLSFVQGGGASSYQTDAGSATTLPSIDGYVSSATRSTIIVSFTSLSPLNQDSYASGDVTVEYSSSLIASSSSSSTSFSLSADASDDKFAIRASPPDLVPWTTESGTCGLLSSTSYLTISGSGFDPGITTVTFDDSSLTMSLASATYSTLIISFAGLPESSYGNLSATIAVEGSSCWESPCSGTCITPACSIATPTCDLVAGFSSDSTSWYGCQDVGDVYSSGTCVESTGSYDIECDASCVETCNSSETLVAIVYPSAPSLDEASANISCTEYAITLSGSGFDASVPSNNLVKLAVNGVENTSVAACSVVTSNFTSITCVFTVLSVTGIHNGDMLSTSVALNISTADLGSYACFDTSNGTTDSQGNDCTTYDTGASVCGNFDSSTFTASSVCCSCGGGCGNFANNVTAYADFVNIATFRTTSPTVQSQSTTILSSDALLTIYGYNFNILEPSKHNLAFSVNGSSDEPTAVAISAARNSSNIADNYGYMVISFYKLGPSNVFDIDGGGLEVNVQLIGCGDTDLCPIDTVTYTTVAEVSTGMASIDTSALDVTTRTPAFTIFGSGFDPYEPTRNVVSFTTGGDSCGSLVGTASNSTRTNLILSIDRISIVHAGNISAVVNVNGYISASLGVNLSSSNTAVVANLSVVAPEIYASYADLSSDTSTITLKGYGFDNGAYSTDFNANRPYYANVVTMSPSQQGPVMTFSGSSRASRSTLVISFAKLNARHIGNLTAQLALQAVNCSEFEGTSSPNSTEVGIADVVVARPFLDYGGNTLVSIDATTDAGLLFFTIKGKGFDSTAAYNSIRYIDYSSEDNIEWESSFGGTPISATRTSLVMSLGPTVSIDNAGYVRVEIAVAEYNTTSDAIVEACPSPWTQPGCGTNSSGLYSDAKIILDLIKGTPTVDLSNQNISSDGTCLYVTGANFEATGESLITNPCTTGTCNSITATDLRNMTGNCTTGCAAAFLNYRNYGTTRQEDGEMVNCSAYDIDAVSFLEGSFSFDRTTINFDSTNNTGYTPYGKILYASQTDICVYVSRLAPQNEGDLYITVQLDRFKVNSYNISNTCNNYTVDQVIIDDYKPATQKVAEVVAVAPTIIASTATISTNTQYLTVKGSGFDKTNQTNNQITFLQSHAAGVVGSWSEATRTRIRFEFFKVDMDDLGPVNGSVGCVNADGVALNSSTEQLGTLEFVSPILFNSSEIISSGNDIGLTLRGSGFATSKDQVSVSLDDGVGGCYNTDGCNFSGTFSSYSLNLTSATRTALILNFANLHRNSTSMNASTRPLAATVLTNGHKTTQNVVAYLNMELYCGTDSVNSTCSTNGNQCLDIEEAPITGLPYICECNYPYGGDLCENTMNSNQIACYAFCIDESTACSIAYKNAALGSNEFGGTAYVSLWNYASDYLYANSSVTGSSDMYSRLTVDDINAMYQCWILADDATNTTDSTPYYWSTSVVAHVIELGVALFPGASYTLTFAAYFVLFFALALCLVNPLLCLEVI
eukprot:g28.t1